MTSVVGLNSHRSSGENKVAATNPFQGTKKGFFLSLVFLRAIRGESI
jgi:hypothetical protein